MLNTPSAPDRAGLRCIAMLAGPTRMASARLVVDPIGHLRNLPTIGSAGPTPIMIGARDHVLVLAGRLCEIVPVDFAETAYELIEPEDAFAGSGSRRLVIVRAADAWHVWVLEPDVATGAIGRAAEAEVPLGTEVSISQGDTRAVWDGAGWRLVPAGPASAAAL